MSVNALKKYTIRHQKQTSLNNYVTSTEWNLKKELY